MLLLKNVKFPDSNFVNSPKVGAYGADIRGIKKDSNTNMYGITISQMPEGVYRQVTKTIRDGIKELGYDIGEDVNIIEN